MKFVPSHLFVWKLILLAVIGAALVLSRIDPVKLHVAQRRQELPQKLEREVKRSSQGKQDVPGKQQARPGTDIVFFGNSLLQAALPQREADLSGLLSRSAMRHGRTAPVRVVNLAQDGRSTWDLERRTDQILKLQPEIIVIQTEIIVRRGESERGKKSYIAEAGERLHNWARFLRTPLLRPVVDEPPGARKKNEELLSALSPQAQVDIGILQDDTEDKVQKQALRRAEELWSAQKISQDSNEYKRSAAFIRRAQELGIEIIIVETPVSETAARFATAEYLENRVAAATELLTGKSQYLHFPGTLPDDCFDDFSHVNRKGQRSFLQWLAPILARKIARGE